MSKHTIGPWHVFSVYAQHEVRTPTDTLVAVVDSREDARLISAAPELLGALQMAVEWIKEYRQGDNAVQTLRDANRAISKAQGASA